MYSLNKLTRGIAAGLAFAAAGIAHSAGTVGNSFPPAFPAINDASLAVPMIGFGADGPVVRTPVVFLHGNGGTPYPTGCEVLSANIQGMAQFFADNGYNTSELWALGYQGTQCDLLDQPWKLAGAQHTVAANVVDLRKFLKAVLAYTGAARVDIVAHGSGVDLVREMVRQDTGISMVRRFVAIEGANQGINICAGVPNNPWALAMSGGYTPSSPVCQELGAPYTAFLAQLNKTDRAIPAQNILVVRNGDTSLLYRPGLDGLLAQGAPAAVDMNGKPFDFSISPTLPCATDLVRTATDAISTAKGSKPPYMYDTVNYTAHVGIANDPTTWKAALKFFTMDLSTTTQKPTKGR